MAINLDTRSYKDFKNFSATEMEHILQNRIPETHKVKIRGVNPFLGSAQQVYSQYTNHDYTVPIEGTLTDNQLIDRAQEHIKLLAPALGFSPVETPEFVPDPHLKITETGERIINLQQCHRGIPIFQMERTVWMEPDGTIHNITGTSVGLPDNLEVVPNVSAEQALLAAVTYLTLSSKADRSPGKNRKFRINPKTYSPRLLARANLPSQPCVLGQKQLGEAVPAHLVFFYQGETTTLGWHMLVSAPKLAEQYLLVVEARINADEKRDPQVLYCQKTSKSLMSVSGNVWLNNPKVNSQGRQMIVFPRPKTDYPVDLPTGLPSPWLDGNIAKAGGNNTIVIEEAIVGNPPVAADLNLNPSDDLATEQRTLNVFYFCNFLHDFFYSLGFNERRKNFQVINPTGEGQGGDPVIVRVSEEISDNTAQMMTLADGSQTLLDVGLHIDSRKSGAIDADVIFHEYTHGVTNRLVGSQCNPQPLLRPQSDGMSEGWSDYFALTIQNYYLDAPAPERTIIGDWITNDPMGLRDCSYDDFFAANPAGIFGAIGRPVALGSSVHLERSHDIGRIWCAALMKMNRDLGKVLKDLQEGDRKEGHLLGWQIVITGLQFTPANPNYLQGRDCIIQALKCRTRKGLLKEEVFQKAYLAVWKAFTRFGMGPDATSPDSGLNGLSQDRNEDVKHIPEPNLAPFDPI